MEEAVSNINNHLSIILKELGVEGVDVQVTVPQDLSHGDYTTNVVFSAAKQLKKSPMEVAGEIVTRYKIQDTRYKIMEKIEAVKPGFINFTLSKNFLSDQLNQLLVHPEKIGKTSKLEGKRVVIEFTDPNPFKEFHIGHLYTNTVGESLSRLFESQGATVWRADYFGDVGMHIAKSLYGILQKFKDQNAKFKNIEDLQKVSLKERIKFIGEAYAFGATAYEEDKQAAEEMKQINRLVYIAAQKMWEKEKKLTPQVDYTKGQAIDENQLQHIYDLYTTGRKWSLEYFDSIYARVGMKFDGYYPESIAGERGYKLVKDHIHDGVFEESDGAIVFRGETQNLHTRVFINSLGLPTYEAKELGLAPWKYEDFQYDTSIIVTGNEIIEYFKVLIAAMTAIYPELGKKTMHLGHGMVRLPEGKMSSRTGKIVTGEWLIDEAVKKAEELGKGKAGSVKGGEETNLTLHPSPFTLETSEQVGIGAIKYAFLKSGIGKDIEFNFETSLSLNGNSGPYLQYTYVRTQSIFKKAEELGVALKVPERYELSQDEESLLRILIHFSEVVSMATEDLAPSTLATYLYELAKAFNLFYQKQRIVDASLEETKEFRVSLTFVIGVILHAGLYLLGIEAPKRM